MAPRPEYRSPLAPPPDENVPASRTASPGAAPDASARQRIIASPVQQRFIETVLLSAVGEAPYRYIAFGGGIRGGKTYAGLLAVLALCKLFPGSRWAVVRRDLPTLRRNTIPSFYRLRPPSFVGPVKQDTWTARCANGSEIIFFPESADIDPDRDRWKGLEVNGFLLEEANELQEASANKAIERAGSWVLQQGRQPSPLVLYTFNPAPNWVRSTFYEPWRTGTIAPPWFFQPATLADNPYLPDSYVASLQNLPELEYRRFVMGDWDAVQGQFFPEFDRRVHLVRPFAPGDLKRWWTYWGGFDWGFNHPAVYGAFMQDGDGNVFLLDSVYMHRRVPEEQAEEILDLTRQLPPGVLSPVFAGADCWAVQRARGGDPPTIATTFARYGISLAPATMGRVTGWNAVRQLATPTLVRDAATGDFVRSGPPRLFICDTPSNVRVLETLMGLTRDPQRPDKADDCKKVDADPETGRGGDDGADMVRYALVNQFRAAREPAAPENIDPAVCDPVRFIPVPTADETGAWFPQLPAGF